MQANPSTRWKNDILPVVEEHDFGLEDVYDAGRGFRQDEECRCDFCGTPLRYTATIVAKDDRSIEYDIGLDCLEHVMGTSWSHLQDVERRIKELKEEAKKKRRKEAFAEEYSEMIEWLEMRLEILDNNNFLSDMLHILKTGESEFTRDMEESVKDAARETDLDELRKVKEKTESWIQQLDALLDDIVKKDAIEFSEDGEYTIGRPYDEGRCSYDFVKNVREYVANNYKMSEKQMGTINDIAEEYSNRDVWKEEVEEETDSSSVDSSPAVPF